MDQVPPYLAAERRRCVVSDAARKRAAHKYTRLGQPVPEPFLRRETKEFDVRHGLRIVRRIDGSGSPSAGPSSGQGSGSGCSASPLQPRLLEEAFEEYDDEAFEDAIGPEDFVSDDIFEHISGLVRKRSVAEQRDDEKRRRVSEDCDDVLLQQGLRASVQQMEKKAEWDTEKQKLKAVFFDLDPEDYKLTVGNGAAVSPRAPVKTVEPHFGHR